MDSVMATPCYTQAVTFYTATESNIANMKEWFFWYCVTGSAFFFLGIVFEVAATFFVHPEMKEEGRRARLVWILIWLSHAFFYIFKLAFLLLISVGFLIFIWKAVT